MARRVAGGAIVTTPSAISWVHRHRRNVSYGHVEAIARPVGLGIAIVVLGRLAIELSDDASSVAAWWPAAGVSVAAVTTWWSSRRSLLAAVAIASLLANVAGGRPVALAIGFAVSNAVEAWVVAAWLHRDRGARIPIRRITDLQSFAVGASLGALAIGIGASITVLMFGDGDARSVFASVVPSHLTAVLVIAPIVLAAPAPVSRSTAEQAVSWLLTAGCAVVVFWPGQPLPLAFLPSVIMIWSAIRFGLRSTAAQLTFVAITVTISLDVGGGFPVWASGQIAADRTGAVVQVYTITTAIVLYLLACALGERESALIHARASEELYRTGFAEAIVGMMLIRLDSVVARVAEVNATAASLLATRVDAPAPGSITTEAGDTIATIAESLAPGEGWTGEMRSSTGIETRWFNVSITRLSQLRATPALASVQIIDSTDHHAARAQLERLAMSDSLTNLPNRVALVEQLDVALERARSSGRRVAITFFDLDDFKLVNDVYGHLAGDALLCEMVDRFRTVTGEHVLARIGGDEFVLMCVSVNTVDEALAISRRIVATMEHPVRLHDISHVVTISGGLTLSDPGKTSHQMLREADVALYVAKAAGKNHVAVYTAEVGVQASDRVRIEAELRSALRNSEFTMHMQPVIDLHTGVIEAAEALIRWHHPVDGLRPPAMWLDIAERLGMMPELGAWVLDRSIVHAAEWIETVGVGRAPILHVNVSARQLDNPGFARTVLETLERHAFPPTKLVLELTETFLAHVSAELVDELRLLDDIGVRIAADDFGTGYSPLTRIIELPISMIKIDRQFVWNAVSDARCQAIVGALVQLSTTLGVDVVAEGVETADQLDLLRRLDCRSAQGYLWSAPVTADAFLDQLARQQRAEQSIRPTVLVP